ncbi:MAG: hypothetical protein GWN77_03145, partial [Gammaproteobacteria bacterium]|nr:hypothetical protein [Gammaproteobacteria bacterium]
LVDGPRLLVSESRQLLQGVDNLGRIQTLQDDNIVNYQYIAQGNLKRDL